MFIQIDEKYLRENEKRMKEIAKAEYGEEDGKGIILDTDMEANIEVEEFKDGKLSVSIDSELGIILIDIPINDDIGFEIVDWLKGKGKKLARLIKLSEN